MNLLWRGYIPIEVSVGLLWFLGFGVPGVMWFVHFSVGVFVVCFGWGLFGAWVCFHS